MPRTSVYLNVENATRSIRFYESLGFKVTERHDTDDGLAQYVHLDMGGADIALGEIGANDDPAFQEWVDTPLGAGVLVTFTVPNAAKIHELAKAEGAEIDEPLETHEMGTSFSLVDPDGYAIMFWQEREDE